MDYYFLFAGKLFELVAAIAPGPCLSVRSWEPGTGSRQGKYICYRIHYTNLCVSKCTCVWIQRQYYSFAPPALFSDNTLRYVKLWFLDSVADPDL
jgi:hypothetical protein